MIGASVHRRSSRHDVRAAAVGQEQVEDDRLGRLQRRRAQRLLGGRRRRDVVARAAQVRLQRAEELRLVVDDEDARRAPRHAGTRAGSSTSGQREHERRALALARLEPEAAAVRLREAARDRQPEARARLVGRPATRWNGSKTRSRSVLGNPRAAVGDADEHLLARRRDANVSPARRPARGGARSRAR